MERIVNFINSRLNDSSLTSHKKIDLLNVISGTLVEDDRNNAFMFSEEAIRLSHEAGYQNGLSRALFNLGKTHYMDGRYEQALENFSMALKVARNEELTGLEMQLLWETGKTLRALEKELKANHYFNESLRKQLSEVGKINQNLQLTLTRQQQSGEQLKSLEKESLQLLDKILALQKESNTISEGRLVNEISEVDLCEMIAEVFSFYQVQIDEKLIQLHFNIPGKKITVPADKKALHQILHNLASGALRFTPFGKSVTVSVYENAGHTFIEIEDERPGIDQQELSPVLSQEVPNESSSFQSNTWISLVIVKSLVKALNGKIECEDHPGNGACFRVCLKKDFEH